MARKDDIIKKTIVLKRVLIALMVMIMVNVAAVATDNLYVYGDKALSKKAIVDSLEYELSQVRTPADSLKLMLNLYDLSDRANMRKLSWPIYEVAVRAKDNAVVCAMLRQLSVLNIRDEKEMDRIVKLAEKLPESDEKKATILFTRLHRTSGYISYLKPEQRNARLIEMLSKKKLDKEDIYDEIERLYTISMYLGDDNESELHKGYLKELEKKINQLPADEYSLRNQFFTSTANLYFNLGNHKEAIEADRQLIEAIHKLEKMYAAQGRKYRNYDTFYYISYRRMLSNYDALDKDEIEDLYRKVKELAARNSDVRRDLERNPRAEIYYYMATGDYARAVPLIKKQLTNEKLSEPQHRKMLELMIQAARVTGDKESLLSALEEYTMILEERLALRSSDAIRDLQIRYDVDKLKSEKSKAEIEKREEKISFGYKLICVSLLAAFILAIGVFKIHHKYVGERSKVQYLEKENKKLESELEWAEHVNARYDNLARHDSKKDKK